MGKFRFKSQVIVFALFCLMCATFAITFTYWAGSADSPNVIEVEHGAGQIGVGVVHPTELIVTEPDTTQNDEYRIVPQGRQVTSSRPDIYKETITYYYDVLWKTSSPSTVTAPNKQLSGSLVSVKINNSTTYASYVNVQINVPTTPMQLNSATPVRISVVITMTEPANPNSQAYENFYNAVTLVPIEIIFALSLV